MPFGRLRGATSAIFELAVLIALLALVVALVAGSLVGIQYGLDYLRAVWLLK